MQMVCFRSTLRTTSLRPPLQTVCFTSMMRAVILRLPPSCRGGMGEAQGDPPRHSVEAQHSTERPQACRITFSHSVPPEIQSLTVRARRYRGLPPPILRTSVFLGENRVFWRNMRYFSRAAIFRYCFPSPAARSDFPRKYAYSASSRPDLPYFPD